MDLYAALSDELASTRELLISVGQRTAQERVAGFFLLLSKRNESRGEDPGTIVLPMTRTDIADYLGLTIETVSRTMTKLRAAAGWTLIDLCQCILACGGPEVVKPAAALILVPSVLFGIERWRGAREQDDMKHVKTSHLSNARYES